MNSKSDQAQKQGDISSEKHLLRNSINIVLSILKKIIEQEKNNQNSRINVLFEDMVKEKTPNKKNSKKKEQNPFQKQDLIKLLENDQDRALFQVAFEQLFDSKFYKDEIQQNKKLGVISRYQYIEKIPQVWKQELAKKKDFSFRNFSSDENAKKLQLNQAEMNEIEQLTSTKKESKKKHDRNIQKNQVIQNQVEEPATQKKQKDDLDKYLVLDKYKYKDFISPNPP